MRHTTAQKVCASWHGGQWSALYSFASTGIYFLELHLKYLQEVESCLHAHEYALHPYDLSKKNEQLLTGLKEFFVKLGESQGLKTVWEKHELYGYLIPYIADEIPDELANQVKPISYMR